MTIIEVARELEKDGTKRFTRESYGKHKDYYAVSGSGNDFHQLGDKENPRIGFYDLLATDWEEVQKES